MNIFKNKDFELALLDKLIEWAQEDGYYINDINQTRDCVVCADYTTHTININIELNKREIKILDKTEKKYLENMLRPFRDRVKTIIKTSSFKYNEEFIYIFLNVGFIHMPEFSKGTMYKGMEIDKEYTLEELGLFKE